MRLTTKLSNADAESRFWLVDKFGLIKKSLGDKVRSEIDEGFIRTEKEWDDANSGSEGQTSLLEVVKRVKPTILIGTSTHAGAFTEEVVREMAKHTDRPVILPLSNPTRLCEVKPEDATKWSDGKALMATGSPFDPVPIPGKDKKYVVAECNNVSAGRSRSPEAEARVGVDIPWSWLGRNTLARQVYDGQDDRCRCPETGPARARSEGRRRRSVAGLWTYVCASW